MHKHSKERQWLLNEKYSGVETSMFFSDLARLEAGEPLAYLIGHIPFLDTTIYLDSCPLIPRPETEYWTAQAITEIQKYDSPAVLDLCAGSGCIGISVLHAMQKTALTIRVDFCEIDQTHHDTIKKNIQGNKINPEHTHIYGGDLFSECPKDGTRYNFILSNPPYIDPAQSSRVEGSVTSHEPAQALFGGVGGMEYIARIMKEAPEHLAPSGVLYIEHEPEQKTAIHTLAVTLPYAIYETFPDQWKIDRYTRLMLTK